MKGARRRKKRYMVIKGISKDKIVDVLFRYFGERTFGDLNIKFMSDEPVILRVAREYVYEVAGILLLEPVNIKIVCITGSLKKAKQC